jgi:hypothetical protein
MMVIVAIVAASFGAWALKQRRDDCLRKLPLAMHEEQVAKNQQERLVRMTETTRRTSTDAEIHDVEVALEMSRVRYAMASSLRRIYERGAKYPWTLAPLDSSCP